jgi:hypothetical protein
MRWRVGSDRLYLGDEGILLIHLYIAGQAIHCLLNSLKLTILHYHSIVGFLNMLSHGISKVCGGVVTR